MTCHLRIGMSEHFGHVLNGSSAGKRKRGEVWRAVWWIDAFEYHIYLPIPSNINSSFDCCIQEVKLRAFGSNRCPHSATKFHLLHPTEEYYTCSAFLTWLTNPSRPIDVQNNMFGLNCFTSEKANPVKQQKTKISRIWAIRGISIYLSLRRCNSCHSRKSRSTGFRWNLYSEKDLYSTSRGQVKVA